MPTVGQITDKISELRSKIAIHEGLVLYLRANYVSSDAGAAEMHLTRNDHATVPEDHIKAHMGDMVDYIDELRYQLTQWENLPVPSPEDQIEAQVRKGKKGSRAATRRHQDHAAPGNDGPEQPGGGSEAG
jgi:hypothetical protein